MCFYCQQISISAVWQLICYPYEQPIEWSIVLGIGQRSCPEVRAASLDLRRKAWFFKNSAAVIDAEYNLSKKQ